MPGPAATPTALKELFGNPGRRGLNELEPRPELGLPDPPEWLSDGAKALWPGFAQVLSDMKVLTTADQAALAVLCMDFELLIKLAKDVEMNGMIQAVLTKSGDIMERKRPAVDALAETSRRVMSHLGQFGLTPAARSKVSMTTGDDAVDALIAKYVS